jgi:hypothetical protein
MLAMKCSPRRDGVLCFEPNKIGSVFKKLCHKNHPKMSDESSPCDGRFPFSNIDERCRPRFAGPHRRWPLATSDILLLALSI